MDRKRERTLIVFIILCTVALISAILITGFLLRRSAAGKEETAWVLRSYGNGVALYKGNELTAVYGDIVLDDLPPEDVALLKAGISFSTKEEAERAAEDYDG